MKKKTMKRLESHIISLFIVVCLFLILFFFFVAEIVPLNSDSMRPRFLLHQKVFINKIAYLSSQPVMGDIIWYKSPQDFNAFKLSRVIAKPGDNIRFHKKKVYINNKLDDRYSKTDTPSGSFLKSEVTYVIPEGYIAVINDNRENTDDSRNLGFVPLSLILGKVW